MINPNIYLKNTDDYSDFNADGAIQKLCKLISFKTVSYGDASLMDTAEFEAAIAYLAEAFPLCHANMEKTVVNQCSLLLKLPAVKPNGKKGVLFMAHMDVVPVNEGTEQDWAHPPFEGTVDGDFIYGRGSTDTKNSIISSLSAMEYLLEKGFQAKRDIYFAFGHDEETLGGMGNEAIGKLLKERGVELEFVIDEGGKFKTGEDIGAPDLLMAEVSVFEKGYANITVTSESNGGHSASPGTGTSLGAVCRALGRIEDARFDADINDILKGYITALSPHITEEPFKTMFSDPEKYRDQILEHYTSKRNLDPLVRTTTAVTMLDGASPAANVLPQKVTGLVNFRTAPGDSCDKVLAHCIAAVNDPDVKVELERGIDPSEIADIGGEGFDVLKQTLARYVPSAVLVPTMSVGGTDARFYELVSPACLRFKPYLEMPGSEGNAHRTDEKTLISAHVMACKMFIYMMEQFC